MITLDALEEEKEEEEETQQKLRLILHPIIFIVRHIYFLLNFVRVQ